MNQISYFYSVVQYMHDPVKNEPLNIGVVIQSPQNSFIACRFLKNIRTKLSTASHLDVDIVKEYVESFKSEFKPFSNGTMDFLIPDTKCLKKDFLYYLAKQNYSKIQFTDPRGGFCQDLKEQVNLIFNTFVGEENVEKSTTQSRFKTQLQKEFHKRKWLLKQRKSGNKIGIEADMIINSKKSGADHVVDFALQNGKLLVIETLDLSKEPKAVESETYKAAFKMDDLGSGRKDFEGISLVSGFDGKEGKYENYLRILQAYSKQVIVYSEDKAREGFLNQLENLIEHA